MSLKSVLWRAVAVLAMDFLNKAYNDLTKVVEIEPETKALIRN